VSASVPTAERRRLEDSERVTPLLETLADTYKKMPQAYGEDPGRRDHPLPVRQPVLGG